MVVVMMRKKRKNNCAPRDIHLTKESGRVSTTLATGNGTLLKPEHHSFAFIPYILLCVLSQAERDEQRKNAANEHAFGHS